MIQISRPGEMLPMSTLFHSAPTHTPVRLKSDSLDFARPTFFTVFHYPRLPPSASPPAAPPSLTVHPSTLTFVFLISPALALTLRDQMVSYGSGLLSARSLGH